MSRSELVAAFQQGSISRRSFIRGLIALGSTTALAHQVADQAVAQPVATPDDTYDVVIVPLAPTDDAVGSGGRNRNRNRQNNNNNNNNRNGGGGIANLMPTHETPVAPVIPVIPATGPIIALSGQEIRSTVGDLIAESTEDGTDAPTVDGIRASIGANEND